MKVTSREIRQQTFTLRFRGYDPTEVDTFLELVAGQIEDLLNEIAQLREELTRKDEEIQHIREEDGDWKKALAAVQATTADLVGRAERQAYLLVAEAERHARAMLLEAEQGRQTVDYDVQALMRQRRQLVCELRRLLEEHLALLDAQQAESAEPQCGNSPTLCPEDSEPSNGPGELAPAPGGIREIVNKGTGCKSRRSSATAAK